MKIKLISLFIKIPFFILLIVFICITSTLFFIYNYSKKQLNSHFERETLLVASSLNWTLSSLLNSSDINSIQRLLEDTGSFSAIKNIRLYNEKHEVIASNDPTERGKIINEALLDEIIKEKKMKAVYSDYKKLKSVFKLAIPVRSEFFNLTRNDDVKAVLYINRNIVYDDRIISTFISSLFFQNIIIFLILTIAVIIIIYKYLFIPVVEFKKAIKEISKGNFRYRIKKKSRDEIGNIMELFNKMAKDINLKNKELKEYSENLEKKVEERTKSIKEKNMELEFANEKIKHTQNKLIQADKMASIGQLAAGIAHEINNPIGFIKSNLEALRNYLGNIEGFLEDTSSKFDIKEIIKKYDIDFIKADISKLTDESIEGTSRVESIVKNLKDFSHVDKGELDYKNVNDIIDSTLKLLWNEIKYKAKVIKEYSDLSPIHCFPQQLNQVFLNIINNAVQAIEKEGIIKINTYRNEDKIGICIEDTGCGIKKENLNKIFDPFFTTKDIGKGTGLGLSIVYDIVKAHNGELEIESEEGVGTSVVILLPIESDFNNKGSNNFVEDI